LLIYIELNRSRSSHEDTLALSDIKGFLNAINFFFKLGLCSDFITSVKKLQSSSIAIKTSAYRKYELTPQKTAEGCQPEDTSNSERLR